MEKKRIRISDINQLFMITVIGYVILGLLIYVLSSEIKISETIMMLLSQIALITPSVIYVIANKVSLKELLRFKKIKVTSFIILFFFSFAITPLMSLINSISLLISDNHIQNIVGQMATQIPFFVTLIVVAVIPAICEESIYRGVFFNGYRGAGTMKAILMSGFLFGLFHMNLNQFSYAFCMGIIFAFIIEATDSIVASMFVHFVINGSQMVLLYIKPLLIESIKKMGDQPGLEKITGSLESTELSREMIVNSLPILIGNAVLYTAVAMLLFYLLCSQYKRWDHIKSLFRRGERKEVQEKTKIVTIPLIIGILICLYKIIVNG